MAPFLVNGTEISTNSNMRMLMGHTHHRGKLICLLSPVGDCGVSGM